MSNEQHNAPEAQPTVIETLAAQMDAPPAEPTAEEYGAALEALKATNPTIAPAQAADAAPPSPTEPIAPTASETSDDAPDMDIVPSARFRGLQRKYSQLEKAHAEYTTQTQTQIAELQAQLKAAHKTAADERLNYLRRAYADSDDVVTTVLKGETLEDVDRSFEQAKELAATVRAWAATRAVLTSNSASTTRNTRQRNGHDSEASMERSLAALKGYTE